MRASRDQELEFGKAAILAYVMERFIRTGLTPGSIEVGWERREHELMTLKSTKGPDVRFIAFWGSAIEVWSTNLSIQMRYRDRIDATIKALGQPWAGRTDSGQEQHKLDEKEPFSGSIHARQRD